MPPATESPSQEPSESPSPSPVKTPPDWRYGINNDGIYRTDEHTGDMISISDSKYASDIIVTEDWTYFVDRDVLYRMDDGNNREQLAEDGCRNPILRDGWIYYISSSGIWKLMIDGSEKQQIIQGDCNSMVVAGSYIFYVLNVPEVDVLNSEPGADDGPFYLGELHRVDVDGEGDQILVDMITDLSIDEDNMVYYSDGDDKDVFATHPQTLEKTVFYTENFIEYLHFDSGYAFFVLNRDLHRMSLADGSITQLSHGYWNSCYGVLDGYVYGQNEYDGLYRVKLDGDELERIA